MSELYHHSLDYIKAHKIWVLQLLLAMLCIVFSVLASAETVKTRVTGAANWSAASTWIQIRTGTIALTTGSKNVTGTGTSFTTELLVGDVLMMDASPGTVQGTIASITDNTHLVLVATAAATVSTAAYGRQAVPASTSDVQIGNTGLAAITLTLDVSSTTINSLTFGTYNAIANTLTHSGTNSLTVTNGVTINQPNGGTATVAWNINGGTGTVGGSLTLTGSTATVGRNARVALTSGTLSITGDLVYNNFTASAAAQSVVDLSGGAATMNVGGSITLSGAATGTLTPGASSTVVFNGTGAQTIASASAIAYNNVTVNKTSGTATLGASMTVGGNVLISQGTLSESSNTLTVTGNFTNNATFTGSTGTVVVNGTSSAIGGSATTAFNNLTTSGTAVSLSSNVTVAGNLNVSSGILDLGTYTANRTSSGGTLTVAGTLKVGGTTGGLSGSNFPTNYTTFTSTGGTINFSSNSGQMIPALSYFNLTSSGTGTRTLASSGSVGIAGTFTNGTNTYTITGSTVDFNGATASTIPVLTVSSGPNYNNLTCSGTASPWTLGGTMNIGNNLTVSGSGKLALNNSTSSHTITIGGNFLQSGGAIDVAMSTGATLVNIAGNFTNTAGTTTESGSPGVNCLVTFNGSGTQIISLANLTNYLYLNYTVANGSTLQLGSNVNLVQYSSSAYAGLMTVNGGGTIIFPASYSVSMNGGAAGVNPTFTLSAGATMITANALGVAGSVPATSMTRAFDAAANYTFNGASGQNTGFVTPTANNVTANVSGALNLDASTAVNGTLTVNSSTSFKPGAASILSGSGTVAGTGTIEATRTTAAADFNSQYTISTRTLAGLTVNYSGVGAQTVNNLSYSNLTISGSGAKTVTSGTLPVSGTLTISSGGVLDMSTFALSGSLPTLTGSGTLRTSNTSSTPIPASLSWPFAVEYAAATGGQTIVAGTYGGLTNSNTSGSNTAAAYIAVNGPLTMNASSVLDMSTYSMGGTLSGVSGTGTIMTASASATPLPSGITWSGTVQYYKTSGGQTIVAGIYNNLTNSNTSGTNNAAAAFSVAGTLTLSSSSSLDMGTYALSSAGSVSGSGNIRTQSSSATPLPTGVTWTGTVEYYKATGGQTVVAGTYSSLLISNTSGTQTAGGAISASGTLTIPAGVVLDMSTYVLSGSFTPAGTGALQTENTSATPLPTGISWTFDVDYNSASAQTIVANNYVNLDGTGGNRTLSSSGTIYISGNFTGGAGIYTVTGSSVNFNGTGAQNIAGGSFNILTFSNAGTKTYSSGTSTVSGLLSVANTATFSVTGGQINTTLVATPCLNVNSGGTLSQSGGTIYATGGAVNINGTFSQSAGTYITTQNLNVNSGGILNESGTGLIHLATNTGTNPTVNIVVNSGGTVNQSGGEIDTRDYPASPGTFNQTGPSALFKVYHDWKPGVGSVFYATAGMVEFAGTATAGTGPDFSTGAIQFANVTVDAGIDPNFDQIVASNVYVSGNFTNNNTTLANTVNVTFTFNGTGAQTISSASTNAALGNVVLSNTSGTITQTSSLGVSGNWTNNGATYSSLNATDAVFFTGATKTISGTASTDFPVLKFNSAASCTMNNSNTAQGLTFVAAASAISLTQAAGTTFTVNGDVTINQPTGGVTEAWNINAATGLVTGNIYLSGNNTTNNRIAKIVLTTGTLTVGGDLIYNSTISATGVVSLSGGAATLNLQGSLTLVSNFGTLTPGTLSNVYYNGTGAQSVGGGAAITYYNLTIDKSSGTATLTNNLAVTNLTINQGTLDATSRTLTVAGNWVNNGGTLIGAPTTSFTGIGKTISGTGTTDFGDVTLATGATPTMSSPNTCSSLTITAAGKNTSLTQTMTSSLTVNGAVTISQPTTNSRTGAWNINTGTATVTGNIAIGGTNTTTTRISKITITSGTLNANGNIAYNSPSATALNAVIDMSGGAGTMNLGGNITLTAGTGTLSSSASSTVNFDGSSAQSVAFASSVKFNNIYCNNPGTVTLSGAVGSSYVTGDLRVQSGTFDNGGFAIAMATGKAFEVVNNATFNLSGTSGMVTGTSITKTFGATSTVSYGGTNQTVSAESYGHLSLSSSSGAVTKTMPGTALTVAGNFSSSQGAGTSVGYTAGAAINVAGNVTIGSNTSFNGSSYTHTVAGNWTNNGTFTASTGALVLSGNSTTLSGSGTQAFNDLTITGTNVSASPSAIGVAGNLATSGSGSFSYSSGTLTMSGSGKTISGSGISLNNLTVSGTTSTTADITMSGNLSIGGAASMSASAGTVTMSGASKTVSNSGSLSLYRLVASGSISTASSFSIAAGLTVSGSMTATAGTATFTGSSILNGIANLYNVTLNGTSLQLATNSVLGIAGAYTITSGGLDVTTSIPNTVNFNGIINHTIVAGTFDHLILTGNTNTAAGNINVNGDFTISNSTTYSASSYTLTVKGDFYNNGTFTSGTDTAIFSGNNSSITGATTFNVIELNKTSGTNTLTLNNDVSAAVANMSSGGILSGTNTFTITNTRYGPGTIMGKIKRTNAFTTGVAYEFEGQNNTITFSSVSGLSYVLVNVSTGTVSSFPFGGSVNRLYDITIPSGTYNATLRLHYDDADLNGNSEASMNLWYYTGSVWTVAYKSANSTTSNYVEQSGLTNIAHQWTFSDDNSVASWTGAVSNDWNMAGNWIASQGTPSLPPSPSDIVQIGFNTYTYAPAITAAATAKSINFGSIQPVSLSVSTGGSLTVSGNISGTWSGNATHTINTNGQTINVANDLTLSDGTAGHAINLNIGTGTVNVTGTVSESGGANITFSGAGNLNIGNGFTYTSGSFTPGAGTVTYNGIASQSLAAVTYKNLSVNKSAGIATISSATTINGDLNVTAGQLTVNANSGIAGNVNIASGATLTSGAGVNLNVGGNWSNSGTFTPSNGTVALNGSSTQTLTTTALNNLTINKSAGTALLGNISVAGDVTISSGSLDISTYTANRNTFGGTFSMSNGTTLYVGGANNFPTNYATYAINAGSTVEYNGTGSQTIGNVSYGNLKFSNGTTNAKTLSANTTVNGDLSINSGATFGAGAYTLGLAGNWTNNGTFTAGTSTVNFSGASKTITGATTFNNAGVTGGYTVAGSNITTNAAFTIGSSGSFNGGSGTCTFSGDMTNGGTLISSGTVTFSGTGAQAIAFNGTTALNTANFNGTVSPSMNSTAGATFNTVNINNTGGVASAASWTTNTAFNVASGASFTGGALTHTYYGSFTNNGTVASSGTLNFAPTASQTLQLKGTSFSSTGTVIFGGTGAISATGTPTTLTNVIVSNSAGLTPASNWTVTGTFTIGNTGIFNAGSYTYAVAGNINSSGVLNGGTSTFSMSSAAGNLAGSLNTTFYDLTLTGNIVAASNFNVSHNFTNNGSFDGTAGIVNMTGSAASSIGGTASPFNLSQLAILKTGGATATLARNLAAVDELDINSGTLDESSYTITQNTGGNMNILANAALKIGGTNAMPTFDSYTIDSLSTVEYNGGAQTITSLNALGLAYGNLTLSASGNKTAGGILNVRNNFNLSAGTFIAGANVDTLGGNWTMSGGSFTNTSSTIVLNGTATQTLSSTGAFNHLVVNKASADASLGSNITVGGTLTFTQGKITTGSYSVITSSSTVSGASQATGWVNGNLQRSFTNGSPTFTFDVGTGSYYCPASLTFSGITAGGGAITMGCTGVSHPSLASSGITSDKTVPVYWTVTNTGSVAFTSYAPTLNWNGALSYTGIATNLMKVARYASSAWTFPTISGTPTTTSIVATGVTGAGDLVEGETCNLAPNFGYTGTPYCQNSGTATVTYSNSGTAGAFTFTPAGLSINTATGAINLAASTPGSYNVTNTVTGAAGCTAAWTTVVTITATPSATIGYTASPYCTNVGTAGVTRTGTAGGSYSSTAGLSITAATGAINLAASTAGTYTITYTVAAANGCSQYTTTCSITITAAPSATISYSASPYCTTGGTASVTRTGTIGGSYSSTAGLSINSGTGDITPGTSTAGTYTVTYTVAAANGCAQYQTTCSVTISSPSSATISYSGSPFCSTVSTGSVTRIGAPGGIYSATAGLTINSSTGDITPSSSTAGTYTVTYTMVNGGCTSTASTSVTITTLPAATISYTGTPYCSNGSNPTVTLTGTSGGAFSSTAGLSISSGTGTVTIGSSTAGSYTVTYTVSAANGCAQVQATAPLSIQSAGTWTGAVSTDWSSAGNWLCGGVPTSSIDVSIPGSLTNYPVIRTGTATVRNLTIQSGASLTDSAALQVAGSFSNSGSFYAGGGSLELNGSSAQSIPASLFAGDSIMNLSLNNSAGATLNGTVKVTSVLKATTGTLSTGSYLTLISNAARTALIDGSGTGNVTGTVTMQRYLPAGYGYKYISSPFTAARVSQLADNMNLTDTFPTLYRYDESLASAGWVNYTDTSKTLNPFEGYAANVGGLSSPKMIDIAGTVNNGTVTASTLYNHNQTYTLGFNLVGNPYPSPIDWNAASGWTKTNIDNAVYYFNNGATDRYQGAYASYINGVSSDGIASNVIASMQGFFVHVSNGSYPVTATLATTNAVRSNSLTAIYHKQTSGPDYPVLRLSAGFSEDTAFSDPAVIYFDQDATPEFNTARDALKMMNTDDRVPSLYSVPGAEKLSIAAIQEPGTDTREIPLGLKTAQDGTVIFRMRDMERIPTGMRVYFADVQTGTIQDLQQIPVYSQRLSKGSYENRFFLVFSRQDKVSLPGISELNAWTSAGSVFVNMSTGKGDLQIVNALGQVVRQEQLLGTGPHEIQMDAAPGVYIVTLVTDQGRQSRKISFAGN